MDSKRSSSSLSARPLKRAKDQFLSDDHGNQIATLPAEMWAVIMDHLDFASVLSLTATSRTMNNDAAPRVSVLHTDKSHQLHGSVGRRFRDVMDVYIYSFIQKWDEAEDEGYTIDNETSRRAVLFLSTFGNLHRVFFGGHSHSRQFPYIPFVDRRINFSGDSLFKESMELLIDSLSAGFQCGVIPACLSIKGLFCPKSLAIFDEDSDDDSIRSQDCEICPRACQHFPLASVAEFSCGVPTFLTEADTSPPLHVCLNSAGIMEIVKARPGGKSLLSSKVYILGLLSRGDCLRLTDQEKKRHLIIVSHTKDVLDELKRAMPSSGDALTIDISELSTALMKSSPYRQDEGVLSEDWILAGNTRKCLKELGLQSLVEQFGSETNRVELALEFMPMVKNVECHSETCLPLIEELVDLQQQIPTQKVIDSGVLPLLASEIGQTEIGQTDSDLDDEKIDNIIRIFSKLLQGQVEENVAVIIKSGFITNLNEQINNMVVESSVIGACKALGHIASTSADFRDQILMSGSDILSYLAYGLHCTNNVDKKNTFIDTLKLCCCSEDMPAVDFNVTRLSFEFCGYLLSSRVHELVEFACQGLDFHTKDDQFYNSQDDNLNGNIVGELFKLLKHESAQLQASALSILERIATKETILTLPPEIFCSDPFFFGKEQVSSYFFALSNFLNDRSEDTVLKACRVTGLLLKTHRLNNEDIKCGYVMPKLLMALSKFAMTRPYNHLNLTEPEHALLLCLKNELQQPMGDSLDDAMWQCKQLDNKINKMSEAEIQELHGTGSSDAMKTIGEFIRNQKKLEEVLAKKITGLSYSRDLDISEQQLNAIVVQLPRTIYDLQGCGLDDSVINHGYSFLSLIRQTLYNNAYVGTFTFLIDCALRIHLG